MESTQFSRRQNLAGQEITQVKLVDVVQSGSGNWGLRLVANGRFVSCEFLSLESPANFKGDVFRSRGGGIHRWVQVCRHLPLI